MPPTKPQANNQPLFVVFAQYQWDVSMDYTPDVRPIWVRPNINNPFVSFYRDNDDEKEANPLDFDWNLSTRTIAWKPLRAFWDRAKAEEYAAKENNRIRPKVNPFMFGGKIADWSSLDEPRFLDWLLDLNLEPPKPTGRGKKKTIKALQWREWWADHAKGMTALQRGKIWEAMDRVRFYEVRELEG